MKNYIANGELIIKDGADDRTRTLGYFQGFGQEEIA
jgi:hypothetical protein